MASLCFIMHLCLHALGRGCYVRWPQRWREQMIWCESICSIEASPALWSIWTLRSKLTRRKALESVYVCLFTSSAHALTWYEQVLYVGQYNIFNSIICGYIRSNAFKYEYAWIKYDLCWCVLQVDKIIDQLQQLIQNYDLTGLKEYWAYLDRRLFSRLEDVYRPTVSKLRTSLYRFYVIHSVQVHHSTPQPQNWRAKL